MGARTAGGPRHHDRNITAQSSIAEVEGPEWAVNTPELMSYFWMDAPARTQVTSDDFEAVDLVVGQPVGARPRGLPEVEGGLKRDAGVFRTEQNLRPHLTMEVMVGMEDVGRGPDGGRAARRVVANDAFIGHADVDVLADDLHREHVSTWWRWGRCCRCSQEFVPLVGGGGQACRGSPRPPRGRRLRRWWPRHEDLRECPADRRPKSSVIEVNHGKAVFAKNTSSRWVMSTATSTTAPTGEARISMVGGDMAASMTNTCSSTASQSRPSSGCTALATGSKASGLSETVGSAGAKSLNHQVGDRGAAGSVHGRRPLVEVRPVKGSPPSRSRV